MNDILLHDVACVEADWYVQTHSTNPLLRPETVSKALHALWESPEHDSLFSVTRLQTRLWSKDGRPFNHDPNVLLRTQDLEPIFEENSNLYIFRRAMLERRKNRIGERPLLFEMDSVEALDIDEENDFRVAEALFQLRQSEQGE